MIVNLDNPKSLIIRADNVAELKHKISLYKKDGYKVFGKDCIDDVTGKHHLVLTKNIEKDEQ